MSTNKDKQIKLLTEKLENNQEFAQMIQESAAEQNMSAPVSAEDFIAWLNQTPQQ
jgi:hypothetical protein